MPATATTAAPDNKTWLRGFVSRKSERGYGNLRTDAGKVFFFHLRNLPKGVVFEDLSLNTLFDFNPVDLSEQRKTDPKLNDRAVNLRLVA